MQKRRPDLAVTLPNLHAGTTIAPGAPILWKDPGDVAGLDFAGGPGRRDGAPQPPFVFHEEEGGGTSPKILVRDANKREWSMKWGEEVKAEVFATRLLWAVGYMTEPSYYVAEGIVDSVGALKRASPFIDRHGRFRNARLELRDPHYYPVRGENWTFRSVAKSPEFAGLKIMLMLVSNWDIKDARSSDPDPNTSVMRRELPDGSVETHYIINDWGATMGRWGSISTRSKWDCDGYKSQTPDFVKGVENGHVRFGWDGKRRDDVAGGINVEDVRWLLQYLGSVTDDQLRSGLAASGASKDEQACYVSAIRARITQLGTIAR